MTEPTEQEVERIVEMLCDGGCVGSDLETVAAEAAAMLESLSSRLAAERKDAERYRWLREHRVGSAMHMGAVLYTPELVVPRGMCTASVDATIDAAIAESKGVV